MSQKPSRKAMFITDKKRRDWSGRLSESKTRTPLTLHVHSMARHFTPQFTANTLQEEMATHPSILAWKVPRTEEPGGLQSTGSRRVQQDRVLSAAQYSLGAMFMFHLWPTSHLPSSPAFSFTFIYVFSWPRCAVCRSLVP